MAILHRQTPKLLLVVALTLLVGLWVAGCGEDDDGNGTGVDDGEGRFVMYLQDAPGDYEEVNIVFEEVRVHQGMEGDTSETDSSDEDDEGWFLVSDVTDTIDLLELTNGAHTVLGDTVLPEGHYTQVRLMIGEGSNVVVDGETHMLTIPSGTQSGLKLTHGFDIVEGVTYEVTLDFDAHRSITVTGNDRYILRPAIRLVSTALTGAIGGTVLPAEANAMVEAVNAATDDTVGTYADTANGEFLLTALVEGTYIVNITPTTGAYQDSTINNVTVSAGLEENLGEITLQQAP